MTTDIDEMLPDVEQMLLDAHQKLTDIEQMTTDDHLMFAGALHFRLGPLIGWRQDTMARQKWKRQDACASCLFNLA